LKNYCQSTNKTKLREKIQNSFIALCSSLLGIQVISNYGILTLFCVVPTMKPNSANKTHGRQSTPSKRNRSTSKKTASNNSAERALNNGNQSPTKLSGFDQVADIEAQHSEDKNDSIVDLTTNGTTLYNPLLY
jgi:hypothetical protein